MKRLSTDELRKTFLDFFVSKDHVLVGSDSLAPAGDASVLFTSAGMNQFKDYFLGRAKGLRRATTCQKCLRTGDLEQVGQTPYHHTFFEMLGNFSFGDYFKKEAILWAWEFVTGVLEIPPSQLWVSVYEEDREAAMIWVKDAGLPESKIKCFGQKDNFWPSNAISEGPNGPCGPCSEIYYQREDAGPVEVWNLVFTQFDRADGGRLDPLPFKNIDTGMGLERMSSVLQGVDSNFQIDIFAPIVAAAGKAAGTNDQRLIHMIADHARAVSFCIGDGILPSNEGRGYVVRKLIRRSLYLARRKETFLYQVISAVSAAMAGQYPEIAGRRDNIAGIVKAEEEKYIRNILEGGSERLDAQLDAVLKQGGRSLSAQAVVDLYVTYGITPEFSIEAAQKAGLVVDSALVSELIRSEQDKSRSKSRMSGRIFSAAKTELAASEFVGYERDSCEAKIIQIVRDGGMGLILDKTPFYGESGGQVGDRGLLLVKDAGLSLKVVDTKKEGSAILHFIGEQSSGALREPAIKTGALVVAKVDLVHRQAVQRAHTATHILQAVLRKILGPHVQQAGSCVEPDRFRFDFTHFRDISSDELDSIQADLNDLVLRNDPLTARFMPKDEAKKTGATALFGEQYGEVVRVVSIADYSKEFCGGTHLDWTAKIGLVLIEHESSVGSGLRRIEALTGKLAYEKVKKTFKAVADAADKLKSRPEQFLAVLDQTLSRIKTLEKEFAVFKEKDIGSQINDLKNGVRKIGNVSLVVGDFKNYDVGMLRQTADLLKKEFPADGLFFLSSGDVVVCVSTSSGIAANVFLQKILPLAGGTGGGRKDFAQGGIKDISKKGLLFEKAKFYIDKGGILESA